MRFLPSFNMFLLPRYRGLIVSIFIFIFFMISVLIFNLYGAGAVQSRHFQTSATQELRGLVQSITRDLYDLKLSQGEDINTPHIRYTIEQLSQNQKKFEDILQAFSVGAYIRNQDGGMYIAALSENNKAVLNQLSEQWQIISRSLNNYLRQANDLNTPSLLLDIVVDAAQSSSIMIYRYSDKIVRNVEAESLQKAQLIRNLQLAAIIIAVLYFLIFIFVFMNRLSKADIETLEAKQETNDILDTVNTGLFLLDNELNIGQEYSKKLEKILGHQDIAGRTLPQVLADMIPEQDLETTRGFVKQLYNSKVKEKLIRSLNPLEKVEVTVKDEDNLTHKRYLNFDFSRVYDSHKIRRVLVNVADITDSVRLEQRMEKEQENNLMQVNMLSAIINNSNALVQNFTQQAYQSLNNINAILEKGGANRVQLKRKLQELGREIHSLKGTASSMKFDTITAACEDFEDKIRDLEARSHLVGDDFLGLTIKLNDLMKTVQMIEKLNERIGGGQSARSQENGNGEDVVQVSFSKNLHQFTSELAQRQHKQVTLKTKGIEQLTGNATLDATLRDIIIQTLRNAVVHGIETPERRQNLNKDPIGSVGIALQRQGDQVVLSIQDDGKGIDYEAIRQRALSNPSYQANDVANWDRRRLMALLFEPGFSTYQASAAQGEKQSDEDAGRGIGLDIIKDRVQKLSGKIKIQSEPNQYTRFIFTFTVTTQQA